MNEQANRAPIEGGTSREAFLGRVRRALGRADQKRATPPEPPRVDDAVARLVGPGEDLTDRFILQAQTMGMEVRRHQAGGLVKALVTLVTEELKARSVVTAVGTLPQALALNDTLRRKGVEVRSWRDDPTLAGCFEAEVGITDVHAAIAESGSLACHADAGHGRGLSLVPPVHVAVVRESDILPDLLDYLRQAGAERLERQTSARALITGPSKTADIEGELVTGVHGPGRVVVLVVEAV